MSITLHQLERAANSTDCAPLPSGAELKARRRLVSVPAVACAAAIGVSERSWLRYEEGRTQRFASPVLDARAGRIAELLASAAGAAS